MYIVRLYQCYVLDRLNKKSNKSYKSLIAMQTLHFDNILINSY